MGLDIIQGFDLEEQDEDFELDEFEDPDRLSVSRTFCNFMSRKDVVEGEADLDQIGRILKVDIGPLYLMEKYTPKWDFEEILEFEDDVDEEEVIGELESENAKVIGNIDVVISTLSNLVMKLEKVEDLSNEIDDNGFQTILEEYYQNLNTTEEIDFADNNLVQDVRNLLRASKLAKSKGAKTTFFTYG